MINSRVLAAIASGFCVAAAIWFALIMAQIGNHTPAGQWVREAYQLKNHKAESVDGNKIVIVSGSNALFGVNSKLIADQYNLPVINQGVNAGVGLSYIIEQGKKVLNPGDVAILPIEYSLYNENEGSNPVMLDYYLADNELYKNQSIKLKFNMLKQMTFKRLVEGYQGLPEGFQVVGLYGPQNMDENGDQTNSSINQRHINQLTALENLPPSVYSKDFSIDTNGWDILETFQDYANENQICLIYIPATIMYNDFYINDTDEYLFYKNLPDVARTKGLTYLGSPFDFMYATNNYFDTNYHLVSESRVKHTLKIISLIGPDFKNHCPH